MKREAWERELKGMTMDEVDNRLKTEKDKGIRQDLVKQRTALVEKHHQAQRERLKSRSHDRGGMER